MTIDSLCVSLRIKPDEPHCGTSQSASHTEILTLPPEAIARLRQGVREESVAIQQRLQEKAREAREKQRAGHGEDGKAGERKDDAPTEDVTLVQRAQPLIHLMEWTLKEGGFILWEAPGDF